MTTLILCEKPSQGMDISKALGIENKFNGYNQVSKDTFGQETFVTWAVGHLVSLADPGEYDEKYTNFEEYPILPQKNDFKYVVNDRTRTQFNCIKNIIKKFEINTIVIATDPAREGENIAYKILNKIGIDKNTEIKRLWLQSKGKKAVNKAFSELLNGDETYPLYIEGRTRELADWLVGMNLSRHYTIASKKFGNEDMIHIGRVATPTLNLINEREKSIKGFKKSKYKTLQANVEKDQQTVVMSNDEKFKNEEELLNFLSDHNISSNQLTGEIIEVDIKNNIKMPPLFFDLANLQAYMNDKYNYSSKETLNLAQNLYEKKMITYPRTESQYITENEYQELKDNFSVISNQFNCDFNENITNTSLIDSTKVDDHYAILTTDISSEKVNLSEKESTVYEEIIKNVAQNFLDPLELEETTLVLDVNDINFKKKGKVIKAEGFTVLGNKTKDTLLPKFELNEKVETILNVIDKETSPPKRLTEKTLLSAMANPKAILDDKDLNKILKASNGLGTAATRADIIENLKNRKYIQIQKNKIYITKKGIFLCELVKNTILSKADMTGEWESYLKEIGKGNKSDIDFLKNIEKMIRKLISENINDDDELKKLVQEKKESNNIALCPKCKKGYVVKKKSIYGCTEYKNGCEFVIPIILLEKKLPLMAVKDLCENGKTKKIKGFTSKRGTTFDANLKFKNDFSLEFIFQN